MAQAVPELRCTRPQSGSPRSRPETAVSQPRKIKLSEVSSSTSLGRRLSHFQVVGRLILDWRERREWRYLDREDVLSVAYGFWCPLPGLRWSWWVSRFVIAEAAGVARQGGPLLFLAGPARMSYPHELEDIVVMQARGVGCEVR